MERSCNLEVLGSKFRLDIRKNFSKITLRQRHRVPREVVETLPLDVLVVGGQLDQLILWSFPALMIL